MKFRFSKFLIFVLIVCLGVIYSSCVRYDDFPLGGVQKCNCELLNKDGKKFVGSDTSLPLFDGGKLQSDDYSRSGKYSVLTNSKNKFALSFTIKNTMPFMYFKISVWRYSKNGKGVLVAAAENAKGLYLASENAVEKNKNEGENLDLVVFVPKNFKKKILKFMYGIIAMIMFISMI